MNLQLVNLDLHAHATIPSRFTVQLTTSTGSEFQMGSQGSDHKGKIFWPTTFHCLLPVHYVQFSFQFYLAVQKRLCRLHLTTANHFDLPSPRDYHPFIWISNPFDIFFPLPLASCLVTFLRFPTAVLTTLVAGRYSPSSLPSPSDSP